MVMLWLSSWNDGVIWLELGAKCLAGWIWNAKPFINKLEGFIRSTIDKDSLILKTNHYLSKSYDHFVCSKTVIMSSNEFWMHYAAARASRILHRECLHHLLRSPMSFFDSNPIGRILGRFSQDMNTIDNKISPILADWLYCLLEVMNPSCSFFIVCLFSSPTRAAVKFHFMMKCVELLVW